MTTAAPAMPTLTELIDLKGRVALVTGAGQGIGEAVARMIASQGAAVAVNDYYVERSNRVAMLIAQSGGRAIPVVSDVSDWEAVTRMVNAVEHDLGNIDILVNNAGNAGAERSALEPSPPFWESDPKDWVPWIAVNYQGVMVTTRAVIKGMVGRGHGRIVTVISDAGRVGEGNLIVYSGAKAGAAGFMRGLAKAVGPYGVTANCVALGAIRTPATEALFANEDLSRRIIRGYPLRRLGTPEDAASLITFLVSDAASWITAQTYPVNGGYSVAL
jgi:NAD(P)-dependent dehydrogenase (short-subunit alcohol dehydrogenase family)